MPPSDFAAQLAADSGIHSLMQDLGDALSVNPDILFLGGGNPAHIPEFEKLMAERMSALSADPDAFRRLIGVYQSPQGSESFISALVGYLKGLGWPVSEANICLTGGSQSAFFMLFNLLAGADKQIILPMLPEYLGYADQGLRADMFRSQPALIENVGQHEFRYLIDFENLSVNEKCAALCVSSPSNPTSRILSQDDLNRLDALSISHDIPLILDCAYGLPFPGIVFGNEPAAQWAPNRVMVLSLSKLGLPGVRTGIVVGPEPLIGELVKANTVMSLANGNLGPALVEGLIADSSIDALRSKVIQPYYAAKRELALGLLSQHLVNIPYRIHEAQGAFFLWLWLPGLPISSTALYERLKQKNVLVMDGKPFFFGDDSQHAAECIRLSYCQDKVVLEQAFEIIARELEQLYAGAS